MKRFLIAAAILATWIPGAPALADPVGFVAGVRGAAEIGKAEQPFGMATLDHEVSVGDVIETRRNAWVKVLLRDDTLLAVDADSRLTLRRFSEAGTPTQFDLLHGHVRTRLGEGFGRTPRLELRTPNATVSARGTEMLVWFADATTWVCSVRGEVAVRGRLAGTEAAKLTLNDGHCARVASDGTPTPGTRPSHLRPVAMRPGQLEDHSSFPARPADLEPRDRLILDPNDRQRKRVDSNTFSDESSPPAATAVP